MKTPGNERGNFLLDLFWNLIIVGLTVAACYVAYIRGYLDPYLKRSEQTVVAAATPPPATPTPTPAPGTPTPTPEPTPAPVATPTPEPPINLSTLNRRFWPRQVQLIKQEEFAIILNGRTVGSATVPSGSYLTLVSIQGNALEVKKG